MSWGHFLVALAVVMGSTVGILISNDRRITLLEERYAQVIERDKEQDARFLRQLEARNVQNTEIIKRLDGIATDVAVLKSQMPLRR